MYPNTNFRSAQSSQNKTDPDWDLLRPLDTLLPPGLMVQGQRPPTALFPPPTPPEQLIACGEFTPSRVSYNSSNTTAEAHTKLPNARQVPKPSSNPAKYSQHGQPTQGQSGHNAQRGYSQSGFGQPSHGQPGYPQPGHGYSSNGQPGYPQPSHSHSSHGQPGYGRSNHSQPGRPQPSSSHSSHSRPASSPQPSYGHSSHGQPSYPQPSHNHGQSGYVKHGNARSPARDTRK